MKKMKITREQARRYLILYQGLGSIYQKKRDTGKTDTLQQIDGEEWHEFSGKEGILQYIKRVGIQYDSLNIVGRNSELVLQSRIPEYKPKMLEELLYRQPIY